MKMQLLTSLIWVLSVGKFAAGLTEHLAIKQSSTLPVPGLKSTSGVKLQRPRKPVLCGTTVPGLSKLMHGVDITELDFFPSRPNQDKDGFREAIFEYTCEQNKTWTSAVLPNYSFPLPDQIQQIFDRNSDHKEETVTFMHASLRSVKESMDLIRPWKDLGLFGSFSASASYVDAKELMLQQKKTLAEAKFFVFLHQVVHRDGPQMTLNHRFVQELNQLPAKFESKPSAYFAFLDKFGTHYFTEAFFGGAMFLRATISSENFEKLESVDKTDQDLLEKFNSFYKLDTPFQWGKEEMSHVLNGTIHYSLQIHGGRTDLANQKQAMAQWINSVPAKPLPTVGSLAQITELIFDKNIRRQMEKAIQIRGLKAYINDFHDVMIKSDFESKLSQQEKKNIDTIRKYVNATDSVELEQIKKMGKLVDDLFDKFQAVQDIQVLDKCRNRLVDLYNETVKEKIEKVSKCPDNPKKKELKDSIDNLEQWRRDLDTGLAEIKISYELKKQLPNTFDIRFIRLLTFECEKAIRNITIDC